MQRPADQVAFGENVVLDAVLVVLARGFGKADRHHLRGVVPFVDRGGDIEAFVALQTDELTAERRGQHFGDLRLADARLAFEQQGPTELQGKEDDRRQRAVGDISRAAEQRQSLVDRGRQRSR